MLTDEQLAAIRERARRWLAPDVGSWALKEDVFALLCEVERLSERLRQTIEGRESLIRDATLGTEERAKAAERENAAMREIVEAVAALDWQSSGYGHWFCPLDCVSAWNGSDIDCPKDLHHKPDCPVTKARALLGKEPSHDAK